MMSKLQRRINRLEYEVAVDKAAIGYLSHLLYKRTHTTKFIAMGVVGGFSLGFLLHRFKIVKSIPKFVKHSYKLFSTASLFLPF